MVFLLTIVASVVVHRGNFSNPPKSPFVYFRYHKIWYWTQGMAVLKGLGAGFIVTAPTMLIMTLVGKEGTIGLVRFIGGIVSAAPLCLIGRLTGPGQRVQIMAFGLLLFTADALPNAFLFNATGVLIFMACMLLARPLQDIAYFTIQMQGINTVSHLGKRNEIAYIANQELGYYVGRFSGCMMFILLANSISNEFALRYDLVIVGATQLLIIPLAKRITAGCTALDPDPEPPMAEDDKARMPDWRIQTTSSFLLNAMINPLIPYGIAGVAWYQGEHNERNPALYRKLFPELISDWRER